MNQAHPEFDILGNSQEQWDKFCTALREVWSSIPDKLIRHLEAVGISNGYQTSY